MFARVLALLPLALLVSATHLEARDQCSTGTIQCCQSYQTVSEAQQLLEELGLAQIAATAGVGVGQDCSPLSLVGAGSTCVAQPTCCTGNQYDGFLTLGCSPISVVG